LASDGSDTDSETNRNKHMVKRWKSINNPD